MNHCLPEAPKGEMTTNQGQHNRIHYNELAVAWAYLMSRLIGLVLFLFPQKSICFGYLLESPLFVAILTNIQNICFFKVLNTIVLHN